MCCAHSDFGSDLIVHLSAALWKSLVLCQDFAQHDPYLEGVAVLRFMRNEVLSAILEQRIAPVS